MVGHLMSLRYLQNISSYSSIQQDLQLFCQINSFSVAKLWRQFHNNPSCDAEQKYYLRIMGISISDVQ